MLIIGQNVEIWVLLSPLHHIHHFTHFPHPQSCQRQLVHELLLLVLDVKAVLNQ